jgi:hypothetical protein
MERISNQRRVTNIPIVCSRLSSYCDGKPIEGVILNTCPDDFYAELKAYEKAGTIIVVRTTVSFSERSMDGGVRSHSLAQVKWSKPISVGNEVRYATGLKYVTVD